MQRSQDEAPSVEMYHAILRVSKAAEFYAGAYLDGDDHDLAERGHTAIIRSVRALRELRKKLGMTKHVFFWSHLNQAHCCEYCGIADDDPGVTEECEERA